MRLENGNGQSPLPIAAGSLEVITVAMLLSLYAIYMTSALLYYMVTAVSMVEIVICD